MEKNFLLKKSFFRFTLVLVLVSFLLISVLAPLWCLENNSEIDSHLTKVNQSIIKGIDHLYSIQFDEAERLFRKVIDQSPEKPAGYFYLAMVTWSRMVSGFWSPETVAEYKNRIDLTIDVARRRIKKGVPDSYDYFYLGGALGFMGRFKLMQEEYFSSFLLAKKGIKALKKCRKIDPGNRDVLLGLGIFDYYTARLSGVLKFLSYLFLHKGDRYKGLEKLHLAAEEAVYSRTEAKSMLLHIYLFLEDNPSKALPIARELGNRYDQDPSYKVFEGVACVKLGLYKEYGETLLYIHQKAQQAFSENEALRWQRRANYLESFCNLYHSRYPEARSKLESILKQSDPENDPAMIAWPLVKIGMTYDLEGDRESAKQYYHKVLDMRNGAGAQFMAKRCLESPPKEKDPIIGY